MYIPYVVIILLVLSGFCDPFTHIQNQRQKKSRSIKTQSSLFVPIWDKLNE